MSFPPLLLAQNTQQPAWRRAHTAVSILARSRPQVTPILMHTTAAPSWRHHSNAAHTFSTWAPPLPPVEIPTSSISGRNSPANAAHTVPWLLVWMGERSGTQAPSSILQVSIFFPHSSWTRAGEIWSSITTKRPLIPTAPPCRRTGLPGAQRPRGPKGPPGHPS